MISMRATSAGSIFEGGLSNHAATINTHLSFWLVRRLSLLPACSNGGSQVSGLKPLDGFIRAVRGSRISLLSMTRTISGQCMQNTTGR